MYINTSGVVLRETIYRDSSKILTVLTGGEGKLTVMARGVLRKNSSLAAVAQLLSFSEMTLYSSRDRWTLTEARTVEQFIGLRDDIELVSLGAYFAELTEAVADEDSPNPELLPLLLNALFALSEKLKTPELVKPAFELRLMAASGFTPALECCAVCGREKIEKSYLDVYGGALCCGGCAPAGGAGLGAGALGAARYIVGCDARKFYSFTIGAEALRELAVAAESYLLAQLDRRFRSLDYYNRITK